MAHQGGSGQGAGSVSVCTFLKQKCICDKMCIFVDCNCVSVVVFCETGHHK